MGSRDWIKRFSIYQRRKKIVNEIEDNDKFFSHVMLVLARFDEALAAISPKIEAGTHMSKEPTNEPAQSVSQMNILSNDSPQSQGHDLGSQIKLTTLLLKKFNGDIIKWCSFQDTFETAINKTSKLATIDKFNYLNSIMEKTASNSDCRSCHYECKL